MGLGQMISDNMLVVAGYQPPALRSRKALDTTNTLDIAIAPAASIGESRTPSAGYKTPAATGTSAAL